jgi:glycosyltransferase involved in cell wall biosynthesis
MRILHATNNAEVATLGIERQVTNLAVAQKAHGFDVMIAIDSQGIFTKICLEHGISVIEHDGLGCSFGRPDRMTPEENVRHEHVVQAFTECVEGFNPDIIHCHSPRAASVAIAAGNRMNIPCVFTGDEPVAAIEGWRRGLRFATICLTAASFEKLLKNEIADMDVYYVPNGTRVMPPTQARQTGTSCSSSLILVASLVFPQKGIDIAILAMVELRRRLDRACPFLNIYGDGPHRRHLTEMATVLQLNDIVRFHGFKPGILEYCSSTDILVMPSRFEVGPLVVMEAMSRGMPIVATAVGEVTTMLPDRRYGRVIPRGSVMALADAIESLLADIAGGQFNPDLLIERHRSLYSIEKWIERIEAAYNQVLLKNSSATVQQAR